MVAPVGCKLNSNWEYIGETTSGKFEYLPAYCLLIKREVIEKIGMFDVAFGKGFWEDTLYSYKAKKSGFKLGIAEGTEVKHLCHQTFIDSGIDVGEQYRKNREIFLSKIKEINENV